ncbi:hypothetical protein V2J09_000711 [Rumex salicifolius]
MNDFEGLLSGDYGFKPQGKSAPMAPSRSNPSTANPVFDFDFAGSSSTTTTAAVKNAPYSKPSDSSVFLDDHDSFFSRSSSSASTRKNNDFDNLGGFDSIFNGPGDSGSRVSSLPVFDKPVYDDEHDSFDDLLGGLGKKEPEPKSLGGSGRMNEKEIPAFDDLLPGFGGSATPSNRNHLDSRWDKQPTGKGAAKATTFEEDPFVALKSSSYSGPSTQTFQDDPLEQINTFASSSSKRSDYVSSSRGLFDDTDPLGDSSSKRSENISAAGGLFDEMDPLGSLGNSMPINNKEKIGSPDRTERTGSSGQTSANVEARDRSFSVGSPRRNCVERKTPDEYHESPNFDTYSASVDSHRSAPNTYSSSYVNASDESNSQRHTSNAYDSNLDSSDDVWLTVSEVPLYTQPTAAPPPSRPPPPKPARISKAGAGSNVPPYAKKKTNDHSAFPNSAQFFQSPKSPPAGGKNPFSSQLDELEEFSKGKTWNEPDGNSDVLPGDRLERNSDAAASAAAMKEAMDRAEARFKHAKETRERENAKATRMQQEREDRKIADFQEREFRERQERERQVREDDERKKTEEEERTRREMEAKEKEKRRMERERIEKERIKQAVERATREARERAAADARARAEKAAVKAQTEARERAERNVVFRAQAEARERAARAAFEAKQRADREKAEREAREKAEREAKEKEARDKAAASKANQQKNENDLESFFGMGSRASSAPRPRASSSGDPFSDSQLPKKQSESVRTSVGSTANIRKTSSSVNIVDDLSSIFGGTSSAGQFQEFEGETEDRRRARLQRHQRTQERAAKALAEKNQRDLHVQNEQAERDRIGETLDVEIKRWAAGKEGNLRALLSTLQYVLWPGCGWQPVSLTDLITAASVKKVYRKATLCIHPDKVQQKGATLQQKYVAEKVFDLLKMMLLGPAQEKEEEEEEEEEAAKYCVNYENGLNGRLTWALQLIFKYL